MKKIALLPLARCWRRLPAAAAHGGQGPGTAGGREVDSPGWRPRRRESPKATAAGAADRDPDLRPLRHRLALPPHAPPRPRRPLLLRRRRLEPGRGRHGPDPGRQGHPGGRHQRSLLRGRSSTPPRRAAPPRPSTSSCSPSTCRRSSASPTTSRRCWWATPRARRSPTPPSSRRRPAPSRGAISMGFCPDLPLIHPFCPGHGIASDPGSQGEGARLPSGLDPRAALDRLPGDDRQGLLQGRRGQVHRQGEERRRPSCCRTSATASPRPTSGRRSSARPSARSSRRRTPAGRPGAAARAAGLQPRPPPGVPSVADLPLVEVPAKGQGGKTLAVIISGDGGWAGIDKDVAGALAAKGIPVVGWNSLQYFWTARKPDDRRQGPGADPSATISRPGTSRTSC